MSSGARVQGGEPIAQLHGPACIPGGFGQPDAGALRSSATSVFINVDPSGALDRARTMRRSGHLKEAIHSYRRHLAAMSTEDGAAAGSEPEVKCELAASLDAAGKHAMAAKAWEAAVAAKGDDVTTLNALAGALARCGRHKECLDTADRGLAIEPEQPRLLAHKVRSQRLLKKGGEEGREDGAAILDALRQSLAGSSDNDASSNLCFELFLGNRAADGAGVLEELLRTSRIDGSTFVRIEGLGRALQRQGRLGDGQAIADRLCALGFERLRGSGASDDAIDDAVAAFRSCLAIRYDSAEAFRGLALSLQRTGDLPASANAFKRSLTLRPKSAQTLREFADCLFLSNETSEAIHMFRRSLALSPKDATTLSNLGLALFTASCGADLTDAIRAFNESLDLRPGHEPTLKRLLCALRSHRVRGTTRGWALSHTNQHFAATARVAFSGSPDESDKLSTAVNEKMSAWLPAVAPPVVEKDGDGVGGGGGGSSGESADEKKDDAAEMVAAATDEMLEPQRASNRIICDHGGIASLCTFCKAPHSGNKTCSIIGGAVSQQARYICSHGQMGAKCALCRGSQTEKGIMIHSNPVKPQFRFDALRKFGPKLVAAESTPRPALICAHGRLRRVCGVCACASD